MQDFSRRELCPRQQKGFLDPAAFRHHTIRADPGEMIHRVSGHLSQGMDEGRLFGSISRKPGPLKKPVRFKQRLGRAQIRPLSLIDDDSTDLETRINGAGKLRYQGKDSTRWWQEIQESRADQCDPGELETRAPRPAQASQIEDWTFSKISAALCRADNIPQVPR